MEHRVETRCEAEILTDIAVSCMGDHTFHGDDSLQISLFNQTKRTVI